jgi:hypothetical protein
MDLHLAQICEPAKPPHLFFPALDRSQTSATKDGTATAASNPSTTPATRQTARSLDTYRGSKSVRTGNFPQTKQTSTLYIDVSLPAPLSLPLTVL